MKEKLLIIVSSQFVDESTILTFYLFLYIIKLVWYIPYKSSVQKFKEE